MANWKVARRANIEDFKETRAKHILALLGTYWAYKSAKSSIYRHVTQVILNEKEGLAWVLCCDVNIDGGGRVMINNDCRLIENAGRFSGGYLKRSRRSVWLKAWYFAHKQLLNPTLLALDLSGGELDA
jgi:hypothetical protein